MKMKQRYHRLRFFVTDAWDEWRHSPGVNFLALSTLASALFLAGLVMLLLSNVERSVSAMRHDVRVEIYLDDGLPAASVAALQADVAAMPGVQRVVHVNKAEALERYRSWASDMAELIAELDTNPLPASLEAFLVAGPDAEGNGSQLATALAGRAGIEEVRFNRDWLQRLESVLGLARVGSSGLALIVFAAVVFVMASVLRLAVYARRDEIEIMLLVGATPSFVRGPFLVAGLAQGIVSSALAIAMVELVRRVAFSYSGASSTALLDLLISRALPVSSAAVLLLLGLVVSLTGSYFAVRRSF